MKFRNFGELLDSLDRPHSLRYASILDYASLYVGYRYKE